MPPSMASPPPATFPLLPFSNKTMYAKKASAEAEAYIETLKELKMSECSIAKQVSIQTLQLLRDYAGHFANLV